MPQQKFENKFSLADEVYLKTDLDQKKRLVTAITARVSGLIYELSCGTATSNHYDFEMSVTADVLIKSTN